MTCLPLAGDPLGYITTRWPITSAHLWLSLSHLSGVRSGQAHAGVAMSGTRQYNRTGGERIVTSPPTHAGRTRGHHQPLTPLIASNLTQNADRPEQLNLMAISGIHVTD